jgi:PhzF family phenazine biosynthesis protein
LTEAKIFIESAFCKDGRGGNDAGVVLYGDGLTARRKQEIARDLGRSETVFVARSDRADFKLEYFTPAREVPLCGHATIAAFALMRRRGMLARDAYTFETREGVLSVFIEDDAIFMEQSRPRYFDIIEKSALEKCFDRDCVSDRYPCQIVSTGLRDILTPIESEELLYAMRPNFDEIAEISRRYDAVGIHAFTLRDERILCRNFAPLYGIPEESATGTSNCALASYLYKHDILRRRAYRMEQGRSLGSPSEIFVRIEEEGGEPSRVFVGGRGI